MLWNSGGEAHLSQQLAFADTVCLEAKEVNSANTLKLVYYILYIPLAKMTNVLPFYVNEMYFCFSLCHQELSYTFRTSLYLAASASAEFFADIALAPMEACKVRIQTQPGWANTLREGFPKLKAEEGLRG